jgi:hypothetical protein
MDSKGKRQNTWHNLIKAWWKENSTISNNLRTVETWQSVKLAVAVGSEISLTWQWQSAPLDTRVTVN